MGRLRSVQWVPVGVIILTIWLLPGCGGHKPAGTNPFPAKITLNPPISTSLQLGSTLLFTASAENADNKNIAPTFTFSLTTTSPSGILDISPSGYACAGSWNAPYYNVCTPSQSGVVQVVASALGATSNPTYVFVHPPIDSIQVSVVPPVNSPPPACPNQVLPLACDVPFNTAAANYCVSQNQLVTLQATAYSKGNDITSQVGPFTWGQASPNVVTLTPIITSSATNIPTNQATITSGIPGQTQVVATASGVTSQPYVAETCPIQCIALQPGTNGTEEIGTTSFVTTKGTSETITATAVDVQGCIVPKPPLTWTSTAPAAITAGSAASTTSTTTTTTGTTTTTVGGCSNSASCSITTAQPGAAAITASCTPPTCNVGFPLNPAGYPAGSIYIPAPVYPVSAISGLVTGATTAANVFATSQDCYSNSACTVALYDISTTSNVAGSPDSLPTPPNSMMFDSAGDKAYAGSQYGAALITTANLASSSTSPFTPLPAAGTPQGLVIGKVIAVSPNGSLAIFSDTVSTPNQVYVTNTSGSATTTALNINSATTAAFTPDNSKAFILGNGGNTLYVYSTLQSLQTYPLSAPADAIAFSSSGAFAFLAGGSSASSVEVLNTCNNLPATTAGGGTFSITGLPATPIFLKMIPQGSAPTGPSLPALYQEPNGMNGLDVFVGIDNTGIDVFATSTTTPLVLPATGLCPSQQIALATQYPNGTPSVPPVHISLQKGTFNPIAFFVAPGGDQLYLVTSDQGVLVYNFGTQSVSAIPLNGNGNPAPVAADMTVDGTLMYVAGTDGILHELNLQTGLDVMEIPFPQLPNSSNTFCYESFSCALNIVVIKP
jgi:hypothetical protein